jgi:hypothetical protein
MWTVQLPDSLDLVSGRESIHAFVRKLDLKAAFASRELIEDGLIDDFDELNPLDRGIIGEFALDFSAREDGLDLSRIQSESALLARDRAGPAMGDQCQAYASENIFQSADLHFIPL